MKIFLSHHSESAKSDVKRIVELLPEHVHTWLDEKELVWGDNLKKKLKDAIKTEVDYCYVLFKFKSVRIKMG